MTRFMIASTLILLLLIGCGDTAEQPTIKFAPLTDASLVDPDNPRKVFRVDLASVEHQYPLSRSELMTLTPKNLKSFNQEQIDQIYGRLTAGPIPDGPYYGKLFFRKGDSGENRIAEIVGGFKGRVVDLKLKKISLIGHTLWKGKYFYRDEGVLRNFIEDLVAVKPLLGENIDDIQKITIDRKSFLRKILPEDNVYLLFPAKLYCGQSLLDSRRESIIIDYAFNDEVKGYRAEPDALAGRNGLRIRDEIRMVRPGLYLGRAYMNRIFLLNFVLYNEDVQAESADAFANGTDTAEDCWIGEQQRTAAID